MRNCARFAAKLLWGGALLVAAILNAGDRAEAAAYAALVMDAATGQILSQVDADAPRYPASLTKMMTLYMLFEALDSKTLKLSSPMKVSALAASRPPSRLGLHIGDTITVREAILALVTKSANDVATVVAEKLGGSETRFAQRMTAKARRLGMKRTTFRNASGLPHRSQLTTARDMAVLGRALLRRFPHYYAYFSEPAFDYDGQRYANHNHLLGNYDGVDGIKTGYIHASGFNLVASAKRDGRRLIGVVFGARSPAERSYKMAGLLDKGFDTLPPVRDRPADEPAATGSEHSQHDSRAGAGIGGDIRGADGAGGCGRSAGCHDRQQRHQRSAGSCGRSVLGHPGRRVQRPRQRPCPDPQRGDAGGKQPRRRDRRGSRPAE